MSRPTRRTVARDQRGTILIIGIFAAALLIGGVYYLVGVNDAIHHREHLQDTADATAWNAATMHARGMNLTALLNMAKLSVVAISTALLAIMFGAIETIRWITRSFRRLLAFGFTIPFLANVFIEALEAYQRAEDTVSDVVAAADKAQDALRTDLPEIAELRADDTVRTGFGPPARAAFTERPFKKLPIERGSALDLCARRSPYSDPPGRERWVRDDSYSVFWPAHEIARRAFRSVPSGTVRARALDEARSRLEPFCLLHGVTARDVEGKLGEERFQLRYYATSDALPAGAEAGVRTATWGADEDGGTVRQRRDQARVAAAQAEFWFDGDEREEQYLWHMAWRPRLRRLRLDHAGDFAEGCASAGVDAALCRELDGVLTALKDAMVH
jgi:hypothetical protein